MDDLPPSDTHDGEAVGLKLGVAETVTLERGTRGVERVAVDLDHEPFLAPKEVDFEPPEAHVALGTPETGGTDEREKPLLGLGAGEGWAVVASQNGAQYASAGMARGSVEERM